MNRLSERNRVLILQKILESKDKLFDSNQSKKEWSKIAAFANSLGYNKTASYFRTTFMYNQKTNAGRRLLQKSIPLTRAHELTVEIFGKNSFGFAKSNSQESDSDASDEKSSEDEDYELSDEVETMNINENQNHEVAASNSSPHAEERKKKRKINDENDDYQYDKFIDKENRRAVMQLKKRKLALEIEHIELQIKKSKLDNRNLMSDFAKLEKDEETSKADKMEDDV